MQKAPVLDFKKEVLKALHKGIINGLEAKECLKLGLENRELPLFFDGIENESLKTYIEALEKMNLLTQPVFRLDGSVEK
jgi:hypothetical protein